MSQKLNLPQTFNDAASEHSEVKDLNQQLLIAQSERLRKETGNYMIKSTFNQQRNTNLQKQIKSARDTMIEMKRKIVKRSPSLIEYQLGVKTSQLEKQIQVDTQRLGNIRDACLKLRQQIDDQRLSKEKNQKFAADLEVELSNLNQELNKFKTINKKTSQELEQSLKEIQTVFSQSYKNYQNFSQKTRELDYQMGVVKVQQKKMIAKSIKKSEITTLDPVPVLEKRSEYWKTQASEDKKFKDKKTQYFKKLKKGFNDLLSKENIDLDTLVREFKISEDYNRNLSGRLIQVNNELTSQDEKLNLLKCEMDTLNQAPQVLEEFEVKKDKLKLEIMQLEKELEVETHEYNEIRNEVMLIKPAVLSTIQLISQVFCPQLQIYQGDFVLPSLSS